MVNNLFFEISGIIFTLFLLKTFFSKKRLVSIGNSIYIKLMISNLIVLLFDGLSILSVLKIGTSSLLSIILSKLYFVSIIVWLFILTTYIFIVSFKKVERLSKNEKTSFNNIIKKLIPLCLLSILGIVFLPININYDNNVIYFDGPSSYLLYTIIFVCILTWIIRCIKRFKYIKRTKSNTILFVITIILISAVLQVIYPQLLLFALGIYFITFALYFFVDNPDLSLISELETAKMQAEEAEASRTSALLRASHEIRTPLNAIVGFSQTILEGTYDNIEEDLQHIKDSSEDLLNVVDNIFNISNVDMQKYKLIYSDYDVELLIRQVNGLVKSKIGDKKVELNIKVEDKIPKFLYGDSIRLKQILLSILSNAVKYTKVGDINFNVGCITIGNICRLIITIKDTGIGISEDKLEKLFDVRSVENKELTEDDINLNLATIKSILESMNGEIKIESEYRDGTSVTIVLDQQISSKIDDMRPENENNFTKDFYGRRVLIVDDDKINLKVASRLLTSYKVIVDEASNGQECIDRIKNGEQYDLIFLDDWMPQMSGIETLKQLDEIEDFNTPVVALTANATSGMRDKYIKDGFNDYIPKPIERKELDRVIQKYLK